MAELQGYLSSLYRLRSPHSSSIKQAVYFDVPSAGATLDSGKYPCDYDPEGRMKSRCTVMVDYLLPAEETFRGILSTSEVTKMLPSRPVLSSCAL